MNTKLIVGIALCVGFTFIAAAIGGIASANAGEFYSQLKRPEWAPPASIFGPVWTFLYITMAVAASLVWCSNSSLKTTALVAYGGQLVLNSLWSWLFFAWKSGAWAFVEVLILAAMVLVTILLFWRINKAAALLMLPYLMWVLFASCLTLTIWRLNPELL